MTLPVEIDWSHCPNCKSLKSTIRQHVAAFNLLASLNNELSATILIKNLNLLVGHEEVTATINPEAQEVKPSSNLNDISKVIVAPTVTSSMSSISIQTQTHQIDSNEQILDQPVILSVVSETTEDSQNIETNQIEPVEPPSAPESEIGGIVQRIKNRAGRGQRRSTLDFFEQLQLRSGRPAKSPKLVQENEKTSKGSAIISIVKTPRTRSTSVRLKDELVDPKSKYGDKTSSTQKTAISKVIQTTAQKSRSKSDTSFNEETKRFLRSSAISDVTCLRVIKSANKTKAKSSTDSTAVVKLQFESCPVNQISSRNILKTQIPETFKATPQNSKTTQSAVKSLNLPPKSPSIKGTEAILSIDKFGILLFECRICQKRLTTRRNALNHVRRFHNQERMWCPKNCSKFFYNERRLNEHIEKCISHVDIETTKKVAREASHRRSKKSLTSKNDRNARRRERSRILREKKKVEDATDTGPMKVTSTNDLIVRNPFDNFNLKKTLTAQVKMKRLIYSERDKRSGMGKTSFSWDNTDKTNCEQETQMQDGNEISPLSLLFKNQPNWTWSTRSRSVSESHRGRKQLKQNIQKRSSSLNSLRSDPKSNDLKCLDLSQDDYKCLWLQDQDSSQPGHATTSELQLEHGDPGKNAGANFCHENSAWPLMVELREEMNDLVELCDDKSETREESHEVSEMEEEVAEIAEIASIEDVRSKIQIMKGNKIGLYRCKICGREQHSSRTAVAHIRRVHLKEKRKQCEICGKDFTTSWNLKMHKDKFHSIKKEVK